MVSIRQFNHVLLLIYIHPSSSPSRAHVVMYLVAITNYWLHHKMLLGHSLNNNWSVIWRQLKCNQNAMCQIAKTLQHDSRFLRQSPPKRTATKGEFNKPWRGSSECEKQWRCVLINRVPRIIILIPDCPISDSSRPLPGAHINPAVTMALTVTRAITPLRTVMYITAQCGGGIAGAALLYG